MKYDVSGKENVHVIAGNIGKIDKKNENLVSVSIANKKGKNETDWVNVAFCNPKEGMQGAQLADLASKYFAVGQHITALATKRVNGNYENYYAFAVELGPKKKSLEQNQ